MARGKAVATKPDVSALIQQRLERNVGTVEVATGSKIRIDRRKQAFDVKGQFHDVIGGVIVDFLYYNRFDIRPFMEGNPTPPDCYAIGNKESELAPHPDSPDPQAKTCKACPHNQFDPATRRKTCKNKMRVAILPVGDNDAEIMILEAPPTSMTPLKKVIKPIQDRKQDHAAFTYEFEVDKEVDYPRFVSSCTGDNPDYEGTVMRTEEAQSALDVHFDYVDEAPRTAVKKSTRRTTRRK